MRTALICHDDNPLSRDVLPAWLASFSDVAGIVVIAEHRGHMRKRLRAEWRRSRIRMLDVFAFRLYYRLAVARGDRQWLHREHAALAARFGAPPAGIPVHHTTDPSSAETRAFLRSIEPDIALARCKLLLSRSVFDVPRCGTVVLHPGICPEYRNAHGCFWALARRDRANVGATMLRIDEGVDTGPVLGYYRAAFDEREQSHIVIQHHVVFDNLDRIAEDLREYCDGSLAPLDTSRRTSRAWGQPRLTDWLRWKAAARREPDAAREVTA